MYHYINHYVKHELHNLHITYDFHKSFIDACGCILLA